MTQNNSAIQKWDYTIAHEITVQFKTGIIQLLMRFIHKHLKSISSGQIFVISLLFAY